MYRLLLVNTRILDPSISEYTIAASIRFLDSLKSFCGFILCVLDSGLHCNKNNSYWYGGQYQNRQTALVFWYEPWNWYFPRPRLGKYHFHWSVPRSLGNLSIMILASVSVTIYIIVTYHANDRSTFQSCVPFLKRNRDRAVVNVLKWANLFRKSYFLQWNKNNSYLCIGHYRDL